MNALPPSIFTIGEPHDCVLRSTSISAAENSTCGACRWHSNHLIYEAHFKALSHILSLPHHHQLEDTSMSSEKADTEFPKEKSDIESLQSPPTYPRDPRRNKCYALCALIFCALVWNVVASEPLDKVLEAEHLCSQVEVIYPQKNAALWKDLQDLIGTDAFAGKAVDWLAGAVKVPSESFDDMDPVGVDPRWETFGLFHEYLLGAFPLVHSTLSLKKVNTYGLLYEWTGSDTSLKPALLAAHQDVVPVHPNTVDQWQHPPFSGYFDGERIWGRGSSDDKSGLIGILITIEHLIQKGFKPTRTIVLSFGFDEEASGNQGARKLGEEMLQTYGEDAFAFVVDEGGGFAESYGSTFATPGVAEKGYLDVKVDVAAPGGHSSVPPAHTSIGMLAAILVEIEKNPPVPHLSRDQVLYKTLQCYAAHGKTVPDKLRHAIQSSLHSDEALNVVEDYAFSQPVYLSTVTTTQAIDLINGGVKTNALPEQASAVINHRISILSSIEATIAHDTKNVKKLAEQFNLTLTVFGETISPIGAPAKGSVALSDAFDNALAPAPRTPLTGPESLPYQMLSGTIKAAYNSHRGLEGGDNIAVSPGMPTGNTDTRYYWKLTNNIFRYNHKNTYSAENRLSNGVHTVNENIELDAFVEMIRFFSTLILNADEAEL